MSADKSLQCLEPFDALRVIRVLVRAVSHVMRADTPYQYVCYLSTIPGVFRRPNQAFATFERTVPMLGLL